MFGLVGSTGVLVNLGVLAINDREPGQTVPVGDPLYGTKASFYVGRMSQDLGKGSNIGLMYTDEEFGGGGGKLSMRRTDCIGLLHVAVGIDDEINHGLAPDAGAAQR